MRNRNTRYSKSKVERTVKEMAMDLAKTQIMELCNAPFKIRLKFCMSILFSKKLRVTKEQKEALSKKACGQDISKNVMEKK